MCRISTRRDLVTDIPIYGSDADANALTVYVTALPSYGYLTINKSTTARVATRTGYRIPNGDPFSPFAYYPTQYWYGTDSFSYYMTDGCSTTATISCTISVAFYDYPPVAEGANLETPENTEITVAMSATDLETVATSLVFSITTLPDPDLGVLRRVSTNNLVVANELFNPGENTVKFVPVTYACCDNAIFTFQVKDSAGQISNSASVSIEILGVNQKPVASASNIVVQRGVRTAIPLNSVDPDK